MQEYKDEIVKTEEEPGTSEVPETLPSEKNRKEQLYDKIPFTYHQVDLFVKVMIGVIIAFLVFAVIASNI